MKFQTGQFLAWRDDSKGKQDELVFMQRIYSSFGDPPLEQKSHAGLMTTIFVAMPYRWLRVSHDTKYVAPLSHGESNIMYSILESPRVRRSVAACGTINQHKITPPEELPVSDIAEQSSTLSL